MQLRPPRPEEAPAVLAVIAARDTADLGAPDVTLADLAEEWGQTGFEPSADARVCEDEGELVAYAAVRRPATHVAVDPAHEGRGIGTRLLAWAEQRERELGWERHRQAVAASNAAAASLLRRAGYELAYGHWRMAVRIAELPPPAGSVPEGARLRPLRPREDARALHALDDLAFATQPDYQPMTLEAFAERHLQARDVDPALSLLAVRAGAPAGFLLARRPAREAIAYVDVLAVAPAEQGRGLGRALLETALRGFRGAGLAVAQLGVATYNGRALALYESVGMRPLFRVDAYERPLGS